MKRERRMKPTNEGTNDNRYQPHEFARRAKVTVRTLHHYDRIGLLRASERTAAGFRVYLDEDFVRLQQIVTLKFIGFSLTEIKRLLNRKGAGLGPALRAQRLTLEKKRQHLEAAIRAIAQAERLASAEPARDWETFQKITEEIQMQSNTEWTKKYYNDEAQVLIQQRQQLWSPELQKQCEAQWSALFRDIEAAAGRQIDPASPEAQALAQRHADLVGGFTGGHAAIAEGLDKLWADQANWPEAFKKQVYEPFAGPAKAGEAQTAPSLMNPEATAFFDRVMAAYRQAHPGAAS